MILRFVEDLRFIKLCHNFQFLNPYYPITTLKRATLNILFQDVKNDKERYWLGWDNSGSTPAEGVCLHHPAGDVREHLVAGQALAVARRRGEHVKV